MDRWVQQAGQDFSGDPNELSHWFITCVNNLVARDFKLLVYQKKDHQQRVPYEPVENLHPSFGLHSTHSILFWTTIKHQHELTIIYHQIRIKWWLLIVISRKKPWSQLHLASYQIQWTINRSKKTRISHQLSTEAKEASRIRLSPRTAAHWPWNRYIQP